jgi:hypothetical protein
MPATVWSPDAIPRLPSELVEADASEAPAQLWFPLQLVDASPATATATPHTPICVDEGPTPTTASFPEAVPPLPFPLPSLESELAFAEVWFPSQSPDACPRTAMAMPQTPAFTAAGPVRAAAWFLERIRPLPFRLEAEFSLLELWFPSQVADDWPATATELPQTPA